MDKETFVCYIICYNNMVDENSDYVIINSD